MTSKIIVLFQQDLRLQSNPALTHAAARGEVIPVFILDDETPGSYRIGAASRWWLHHSLAALKKDFQARGVHLIFQRGETVNRVLKLAEETQANGVYWNRCYEPYNIAKNTKLKIELQNRNLEARSFNASLLFEPWDILNKQGQYFKVFTPFWNHCLKQANVPEPYDIPPLLPSKITHPSDALEDWHLLPTKPDWAHGLKKTWQPGEAGAAKTLSEFLDKRLAHYQAQRDFPAQHVNSCLSPHLHFGEISPQQIWHAARQYQMQSGSSKAVEKFLSEIGWREFSYYLLYHFPELAEKPFDPKFADIEWLTNANHLKAWQRGQTGYPIVDAGMRELWHTGIMHNRVRMIVASFLTKDLRIHWREGAAWFWDTLVDADLASNSASWQWVAGSGADASPYFRIFNPVLQGTKFDAHGEYVRRWVPELSKLANKYIHSPWQADENTLKEAGITLGKTYPAPLVDHGQAREAALAAYQKIRKPSESEY
jgi:deoxyribodipyrimidine photo-lyase